MKRVGYLYEKVMTYENVISAMQKYDAKRPVKLRKGVDYRRAWDILDKMKTDYEGIIGKPRHKVIHEYEKERYLEIPSYESSVAQIALWNICGPYVERRIHSQSFSSRKGMGGHLAAKKCERFVHTNIHGKAKYHLYFDISKFYKHVDKRIVMQRLQTVFKDKRVLKLFNDIINSADFGLPIGYPFSHALANFYLVPLYFQIMSVKGISKAYVYMDNWIVFSHAKKALKHAKAAAVIWLKSIGCQMKHDWQIAPTAVRGVKLCGFIISSKPTHLYRRIWHRLMRNVDRCIRQTHSAADMCSLASRLGWLKAINRQYSPSFHTEKGFLWK